MDRKTFIEHGAARIRHVDEQNMERIRYRCRI
jgi:hypothetical protein